MKLKVAVHTDMLLANIVL